MNLGQLNEVLFEQLNNLTDKELKGEDLREEIERSKSVSDISKTIISNANLVLRAEQFKDDKWNADAEIPNLLEG